ncbi:hypothetical protein QC763_400835 [Podospora pseudopauciseta]|uniref:Uncharacterized protein n=2 Tax=Podospora TaxID=5144 RepID=A0ABR0HB78_9PEZI|nr:hypothetical protein QC763_400835 [Podospora pseudopauciseta]KAK4676465.1 hypothetical protein QC764_400835 [Podospora pseudoanserina]
MAVYNPNISNGTCYYTEDTPTKGDFIPCGNEALQVWPCCHTGSFCLSLGEANACWDKTSGNTYVAGCTDPSFTDPNCLYKRDPFHSQEWVAINQACKNLNAASSPDTTNWTGCKVPDNSTELVKLSLDACTPYCNKDQILYPGSSSLAAYASLPTIPGSSIFWQNNYVPPTAPAAGYTPGKTRGVVPTYTGKSSTSSSAASPESGGLSPGAKAGIGVGAAIGGILLLLILGWAIVLCRRKRRRQKELEIGHYNSIHGGGHHPGMVGVGSPGGFSQSHYSQQDAMTVSSATAVHPSPPPPFNSGLYYAHNAAPGELPGTTVGGGQSPGQKSELPADERFSVQLPT